MVNYNNGKIYKIIDNTTGNIYVGSTVKTLSQRLGQHRLDYKKYLDGKKNFISSFDILKNNDYSIVLLEECKTCETKEQLLARERFYIDTLECVNIVKPLRTGKDWYYDNFEKLQEQKKDYYKQNIQRLAEYRIENCERIKETKRKYYELHKQEIQDKKKVYVEENKLKVSQQRKLKYEENKASILEKLKEVINCPDCGVSYTKCHKSRHIKSQRHLNALKDIIY